MKKILSTFILAAAIGCDRSQTPQNPQRPVQLLLGQNASGSSADLILLGLVSAARMASLAPTGSSASWYRLHSSCDEVPPYRIPFNRRAVLKDLIKNIPPSANQGTRLDLFLSAVHDRCEGSTLPVIAFLYGDGYNEQTSGQDLQRIAAELSADASFRALVVVGAEPGSIEFLRQHLKPISTRLWFQGFGERASLYTYLGGQ